MWLKKLPNHGVWLHHHHHLLQRGEGDFKNRLLPCGRGLLPQTWCEQILYGQHAPSNRKVKMVNQTELPNAKRKKKKQNNMHVLDQIIFSNLIDDPCFRNSLKISIIAIIEVFTCWCQAILRWLEKIPAHQSCHTLFFFFSSFVCPVTTSCGCDLTLFFYSLDFSESQFRK